MNWIMFILGGAIIGLFGVEIVGRTFGWCRPPCVEVRAPKPKLEHKRIVERYVRAERERVEYWRWN